MGHEGSSGGQETEEILWALRWWVELSERWMATLKHMLGGPLKPEAQTLQQLTKEGGLRPRGAPPKGEGGLRPRDCPSVQPHDTSGQTFRQAERSHLQEASAEEEAGLRCSSHMLHTIPTCTLDWPSTRITGNAPVADRKHDQIPRTPSMKVFRHVAKRHVDKPSCGPNAMQTKRHADQTPCGPNAMQHL
jgi:hypothetical protein